VLEAEFSVLAVMGASCFLQMKMARTQCQLCGGGWGGGVCLPWAALRSSHGIRNIIQLTWPQVSYHCSTKVIEEKYCNDKKLNIRY